MIPIRRVVAACVVAVSLHGVQAQGPSLEPVGGFGGWIHAVAPSGTRVAVGQGDSVRIIDASNLAQLQVLGGVNASGEPSRVVWFGDRVLHLSSKSLDVVNAANSAAPFREGRLAWNISVTDCQLWGSLAVLAAYTGGVRVVDLSNPAAPRMVATNKMWATHLVLHEQVLYVFNRDVTEVIGYDAAALPGFVEVSRTPVDSIVQSMAGIPGHLVLGTGSDVRVLSTLDRGAPTQVAAWADGAGAWMLQSTGSTVVVAMGPNAVDRLVVLDLAEPALPRVAGRFSEFGVWDMALQGSNLWYCVRADPAPLRVLDVGNPASIRRAGQFEDLVDAEQIVLSGTQMFVRTVATRGPAIYSITNPAAPRLLAMADHLFVAQMAADGGRLYETFDPNWQRTVAISDISQPGQIRQLSLYNPGGDARLLAARGDLLCIAVRTSSRAWLDLVDVSHPATPVKLGEFALPGGAGALAIASNLVYAACTAGTNSTLEVVDVSTPATPVRVTSVLLTKPGVALGLAGDRVFVSEAGFADWRIEMVDLSDPASPAVRFGASGTLGQCWGLKVIGNHLFAAITGRSVVLYNTGAFPLQEVAVCSSPGSLGLAMTEPNGDQEGYVFTPEGFTSGSQNELIGRKGVCIQRYKLATPSETGALATEIEPAAAAKDGCTSEPAALGPVPLGSTATVTARSKAPWNFHHWSGAASGTEPSTTATISSAASLAVAHFVKPTLTLGGGEPPRVECPGSLGLQDPNEALSLHLTANDEAEWMVHSLKVQILAARGDPAEDVTEVRLMAGNTVLDVAQVTPGSGYVNLAVGRPVPAGGSLALKVLWKLSPAIQWREATVHQYQVMARADWVAADPMVPDYPNFAILPPEPVLGGALVLAPVHNDQTGEGFATIQEGIDSPSTAPGNTLSVCPGVYQESVTVTKPLTIRGLYGRDSTYLVVNRTSANGFTVLANDVRIEGFSIVSDSISRVSVGVEVKSGFKRTVIRSNRMGGHMYAILAREAEGLVVAGNALGYERDVIPQNYNAAVVIRGSPDCVLTNNAVVDNMREGVVIIDSPRCRVVNNTLSANAIALALLGNDTEQAVVQGNRIGTDSAGLAARPNAYGIVIDAGGGSRIGGAAPGEGNIIAGNENAGITLGVSFERINGALREYDPDRGGNVIQGNLIGVAADGATPLPNRNGIHVGHSATNLIGGSLNGEGNVISGNAEHGILILPRQDIYPASGNMILGNRIGTTADGLRAAPNRFGVVIDNLTLAPQGNAVGGLLPGSGNLVSGNLEEGIHLGSISNTVHGNLIGTTLDGLRALPNGTGILIQLGGTPGGNLIGGGSPAARNVISGNRGNGIGIKASGENVIQGNLLGVSADGRSPLGNGGHGVGLIQAGGSRNRIGGTSEAEANHIAFNGSAGQGAGVLVEAGSSNSILGNSIHDNAGLGIDLGPEGPNFNASDQDDALTLPGAGNRRQNHPLILSTIPTPVGVTVEGFINSWPSTPHRLEFYSNPSFVPPGLPQGEMFLAFVDVTTSGNGQASFTVTLPPEAVNVTATATDSAGNTSEFPGPFLLVNTPGDAADVPGDDVADTDLATPGLQTTLRAALQEAERRPGIDLVVFGVAGGTPVILPRSPLPTITHPVWIDASTQPISRRAEIDGSLAGPGVPGLVVHSQGVRVTGLTIRGFRGNGLELEGDDSSLQKLVISENHGLGILATKPAKGSLSLLNSVVQGNHRGGILARESNVVLMRSTIAWNKRQNTLEPEDGDGVYGLSLALSQSTLQRNEGDGAHVLKGIIVYNGESKIISNGRVGLRSAVGVISKGSCIVQDNGEEGIYTAEGEVQGAGFMIADNHSHGAFAHRFSCTQSTITHNRGDGVRAWGAGILNSEVTDNHGTGVDCEGGMFAFSTFCNNAGGNLRIKDPAGFVLRGITVCEDSDQDQASADIEDRAANNGDGNHDGIPDRHQANVASVRTPSDQPVTVAVRGDAVLRCVAISRATPGSSLPTGVRFRNGYLTFQTSVSVAKEREADEATRTESITVQVILAKGEKPRDYLRYGPTPDRPEPHWYSFLFDGITGAQINGNVVTLHLKDGARGDDDLVADGVILHGVGGPTEEASLELRELSAGQDGVVRLTVRGTAGPWTVEGSLDLQEWETLGRTNMLGNTWLFEDVAPPGAARRFYRAVLDAP